MALPTESEPLGRGWHLTTVQLLPPSSKDDFILLAGCGIGIVTGTTHLLAALLGTQVEYAVAEAQNIKGCLETVLITEFVDDFYLFIYFFYGLTSHKSMRAPLGGRLQKARWCPTAPRTGLVRGRFGAVTQNSWIYRSLDPNHPPLLVWRCIREEIGGIDWSWLLISGMTQYNQQRTQTVWWMV